jgi:hypothetical protein
VSQPWKRFRIIVNSESDFRIQASSTGKPVEEDREEWTEVHKAYKWSEAITVYRKMMDGNWTF